MTKWVVLSSWKFDHSHLYPHSSSTVNLFLENVWFLSATSHQSYISSCDRKDFLICFHLRHEPFNTSSSSSVALVHKKGSLQVRRPWSLTHVIKLHSRQELPKVYSNGVSYIRRTSLEFKIWPSKRFSDIILSISNKSTVITLLRREYRRMEVMMREGKHKEVHRVRGN